MSVRIAIRYQSRGGNTRVSLLQIGRISIVLYRRLCYVVHAVRKVKEETVLDIKTLNIAAVFIRQKASSKLMRNGHLIHMTKRVDNNL